MDWTNGAWRSTKHRVVFPGKGGNEERTLCEDSSAIDTETHMFTAEAGHRYSLVYFVGVNHDAVMAPVHTNTSEDSDMGVVPSEGISYNQWRKQRVRRAMDQLKGK